MQYVCFTAALMFWITKGTKSKFYKTLGFRVDRVKDQRTTLGLTRFW